VPIFVEHLGTIATSAGAGAKVSLAVMITAAVLLTVGWRLAAAKRYAAHRWVQTAAVVLNAIPVVAWMIRSYWRYVLPDLPGNLSKGVDLLTTVHAVVGLIGVILGVFIVIRGNQLEAQGRSLSSYKTPMRIAYVVYLAGTALGIGVYWMLYR
jgi:uncharacterized membrane protein YozB (DUF420 family)